MRVAPPVVLDDQQRKTLEQWARSRSLPIRQVQRAKIILMAADGKQDLEIAAAVNISNQNRRRAAHRSRRGPRPAAGRQRPGHRGRGILHRRLAPRDPLHPHSSQLTATSSLEAIAAAGDAAARAALHTLNVPGRQRHSKRAQKAGPKFRHATATKQTVTGKPQVIVFAPGFS